MGYNNNTTISRVKKPYSVQIYQFIQQNAANQFDRTQIDFNEICYLVVVSPFHWLLYDYAIFHRSSQSKCTVSNLCKKTKGKFDPQIHSFVSELCNICCLYARFYNKVKLIPFDDRITHLLPKAN